MVIMALDLAGFESTARPHSRYYTRRIEMTDCAEQWWDSVVAADHVDAPRAFSYSKQGA